MIELPQ